MTPFWTLQNHYAATLFANDGVF